MSRGLDKHVEWLRSLTNDELLEEVLGYCEPWDDQMWPYATLKAEAAADELRKRLADWRRM
jgi:hypothetical protein